MSFGDKFRIEPAGLNEGAEGEVLDPMLEQTLRNFASSVRAWSEAAYNMPRTALQAAPQRKVWRLAAGWALGCALVAGGVSGGLYEHHHRQEMARVAAAQQAERQRAAAEQRAREEEDLMARVDSDISREVPIAMEPLAQLMAEDETK